MLAAIAVAVGIILGAFSGLMPGIHSNTIASVLSGLPIDASALSIIVVAVLGAHIVFQFFPSIFLSIPDDTVVASVLPGHRLALAGKGREAISVCIISVLLAIGASAALLPISLLLIPFAYSLISPNMAVVLLLASAFLLASEREGGKIAVAALIFLLAGALGIATMRGTTADPLFPAFSGLFAASGILLSFTSGAKLPPQGQERTKVDFLPYVGAGVLFGMLSDLLPGIAAPAQIAVFASAIFATDDARKFLALVSSIAASHAVFAFGALVSIGKAREGALAIINSVKPIGAQDLPLLIGAFLLSAGAASLLLLRLSRHANALAALDMRALNLGVLAYLLSAVAIISGAQGLLVFATATAVGLLPPLLGVRRTHVMGLIIVPSILLSL